MSYKPSKQLLLNLCKKIKNKHINDNKNLKVICLREHKTIYDIYDHLINIVLAFSHHNFIIFVSCPSNLYEQIINEKINICYIKFSKDDGNLQEIIVSLMRYSMKLNYKYFIFNTASEYYHNYVPYKINVGNDKLNKNINEIVYTKESFYKMIQNNIKNNEWIWWPKLLEKETTHEFFYKENIQPSCNPSNCLIMTKKICEHFLRIIKNYVLFENPELYFGSFIKKYYKNFKYNHCILQYPLCITPEIVEFHKEKIKENNVDYLTLKRIDCHNRLLKYLHKNFMEIELKKYKLL